MQLESASYWQLKLLATGIADTIRHCQWQQCQWAFEVISNSELRVESESLAHRSDSESISCGRVAWYAGKAWSIAASFSGNVPVGAVLPRKH